MLLKRVHDVYDAGNLFQIEHAVPPALILVSQFVDSGPDRFHGLAVFGHLPELHLKQRITQVFPYLDRESPQYLAGITQPGNIGLACD